MDPLILESDTNLNIDSPMAMNHLYSNWCAIMHMIFKFNLETTCDSVTINPKADNDTSAMITSQTLVTKLPLEDVPVSGIMNAYPPYYNHSFHPSRRPVRYYS